MKKHRLFMTLVTVALVIVTLEITSPPLAVSGAPPLTNQVDHPQPQGVICILFIIIAVVVGVIIWGLLQMCKKIPNPPPPNDGQPTNITIASFVVGPDRYMQFQFDPTVAQSNYFLGGKVFDEQGNPYVVECAYALYCSSNYTGPWKLDAYVTNWLGGSMVQYSNSVSVTLTNQEMALYDTNGNLLSARRWWVDNYTTLSNCIQPRILMPPRSLDKQFYRAVLLEQ